MKKTIITAAILLLVNFVFAQSKTDSLVRIGVQLHDCQQYAEAIEFYKKALEIDPESVLANYEIGLSYSKLKEYEKSNEHLNLVIKNSKKLQVGAYSTKGSNLDDMGKQQEAIKCFDKGIKKTEGHYLLYYNKGLTQYRINDLEGAKKSLLKAIESNSNHPGSHLLLGYLMADMNSKTQSLLCFHYFLLLEPNSSRSEGAYKALKTQFEGNVSRDPDDPTQISINFAPTDDEMFVENTTSFFKILGELNKKKNTGLWWDFYIPFFYEVANSSFMETYCNYISQSSNDNANMWINSNLDKLKEFGEWMNNLSTK